ncbi:MAG: serine/threonine protein kinase [Kofleriaceae bacterium]|nr:serine/threonine protein kinase [Kofleriaceae bacterium]
MDCDDFMLALAESAGEGQPAAKNTTLQLHRSRCASCDVLAEEWEREDEAVDPIIGTSIGSHRVESVLGEGGMGRVYLAVHPDIGSRVAIKVFSRDWENKAGLVDRFFAEARASNLVRNENIIDVIDVGRLPSGRPYMVMQHLDGAALASHLSSRSLSEHQIFKLILDVLSGLAAAHEQHIIHRDLKPDNIFVSPEGKATILDFGIAKLSGDAIGNQPVTATGLLLGTPHYMAPEQAVGDLVDARTDLYAVGIILYESIVGKRPFDGGSLYQLLDMQVTRKPPRPSLLRPDIDASVEALILRAIEKRPDDRFQSADEMKNAIEAVMQGHEFTHSPIEGGRLSMSADGETPLLQGAATVAQGPAAKNREQESFEQQLAPTPFGIETLKTRNRPLLVLGLGVIPAIVVAAIAFYLWPTQSARIEKASAGIADAGGIVTLASADARRATSVAVPVPVPADSGPMLVAMTERPKAKNPRVSNPLVDPLSLYNQALHVATNSFEDAAVKRIEIVGEQKMGRLDLGTPSNFIDYTFFSRERAERILRRARAGKVSGKCGVRVRYQGSLKPQVKIVSLHDCKSARPTRRPGCTLRQLIKRHRAFTSKRTYIAATFGLITQRPASRPFWRLVLAGKKQTLEACPL